MAAHHTQNEASSTSGASQEEEEGIRRFARFEWLARQIELAVREADARGRLEQALRRLVVSERAAAPRPAGGTT